MPEKFPHFVRIDRDGRRSAGRHYVVHTDDPKQQMLKEKIVELTRYIEPAMIIIMGAIIGGVALALMLPIFTISRVVAQ